MRAAVTSGGYHFSGKARAGEHMTPRWPGGVTSNIGMVVRFRNEEINGSIKSCGIR